MISGKMKNWTERTLGPHELDEVDGWLASLPVQTIIGIDFETYSDVDIRKFGLQNYFNSPNFRALVVAVSSNGESLSWDLIDESGEHSNDAVEALRKVIHNRTAISAHNAAFEEMVLDKLGIWHAPLLDSAVSARMTGYSSALGRAVQQAGAGEKVELGEYLISKFCIPSKEQVETGDWPFDTKHLSDEQWEDFHHYCRMDAYLTQGLLNNTFLTRYPEAVWAQQTRAMNRAGWRVDMDLVGKMIEQVKQNEHDLLRELHKEYPSTKELNLNSPQQMYEWCKARGVRAKSFDKLSVQKMASRIDKRLTDGLWLDKATPQQVADLQAVLYMLSIKQQLGGTAVTKLKKIVDLVDDNGILRDNYLHFGAGQTGRTTGSGVQMQNLKRLGHDMPPLDELWTWDNDTIGDNLRRVFTSHNPDGELFVADFSSIEARALAFIAGDGWVVDAFQNGEDLYKLAAAKKYGCDVDKVTSDMRTFGKVGILSCGYGAGHGAVKSFAEGMGVILTDFEAADIVEDFRSQRPATVSLWNDLDEALRGALSNPGESIGVNLPNITVYFQTMDSTPQSLLEINPDARSVMMFVNGKHPGSMKFARVIHGCYLVGNEVRYYKAMSGKNTELWRDWYTDPKTKQRAHYKMYGGKLTGILVQSFCREIFMAALKGLSHSLSSYTNVRIIGQFHDEIVVDWVPGDGSPGEFCSKELLTTYINTYMSSTDLVRGLPMAVEVSSDYRYIK